MPKHNRSTGRGQQHCSTGPDSKRRSTASQAGHVAQAGTQTLTTMTVGVLPILNRLLERMQLETLLQKHLKPDGARTKLPTASALLVLVRNLLMSREPIYGIGEWAAHYAPDLLGLRPEELAFFNDDRLGRSLDRLFAAGEADLVVDVVRHMVKEFDLSLDEIHNDSTTISFFGDYPDADEEGVQQGRPTPRLLMVIVRCTGRISSSFYMS